MTPLQTPTSPSFFGGSSHPATPLSPSFNHPLDSLVSTPISSPRLSIKTTFPFHSFALSQPSPVLGQQSSLKPVHKRNTSSVSTISFSSPAITEAIYQHLVPPTPKTPRPNVPFFSLLSPGGPTREDGRQSRMGMHSPIVERILSLPLRVSPNSARTPPSEPRFPNPPNSIASTEIESDDDAMSIVSSPEPLTAYPLYDTPLTPVIHISAPPPPRSNSQAQTSKTTKRPRSPPPHYHLTTAPTLCSTLCSTLTATTALPSRPSCFPSPAHAAAYANAVTHLSTPLVPLISVTTGLPHPHFPRSLLQYHLLTHHQLDSLARWYHQTQPATEESWMYPAWIPPYTAHAAAHAASTNAVDQPCSEGFEEVMLKTKRRRWGRFIGLRGCESPVEEESQEAVMERMEREWVRQRERLREEEISREKGWRGRW